MANHHLNANDNSTLENLSIWLSENKCFQLLASINCAALFFFLSADFS